MQTLMIATPIVSTIWVGRLHIDTQSSAGMAVIESHMEVVLDRHAQGILHRGRHIPWESTVVIPERQMQFIWHGRQQISNGIEQHGQHTNELAI
jgi:hypothetical protein